MGELIDDLLQFSRTGRAEMHLAGYEMQPIVNDLISGIMRDEPDRKFNWKVAPLPHVVCDQPLIGRFG